MGVDHWIAFGLLAFIGSKMIYDTTRKEKEKKQENLSLHSILTLAVASSIDALMDCEAAVDAAAVNEVTAHASP